MKRHERCPRLELEIAAATGKRYVQELRGNLLAAHAILRPALLDLSLALVGDRAMSRLHGQFMQIDGPTDVLSFPLDSDDRGRVTAGEVVVCVPEAVRQARFRGGRISRELLLYALHGMLHLAGFDDKTEWGYRTMHRKEDQLLTALGIGPVFAGPRTSAIRSATARPKRRSRGAR